MRKEKHVLVERPVAWVYGGTKLVLSDLLHKHLQRNLHKSNPVKSQPRHVNQSAHILWGDIPKLALHHLLGPFFVCGTERCVPSVQQVELDAARVSLSTGDKLVIGTTNFFKRVERVT